MPAVLPAAVPVFGVAVCLVAGRLWRSTEPLDSCRCSVVAERYFGTRSRQSNGLCRLLGVLFLLVLSGVHQVQAKDLNGRFGIGVEQSLGGVTGVTLRYFPTRSLGVLFTGGMGLSVTEEDLDNGESKHALSVGVAASLGIVYNFARSLHANLGIGARVSAGLGAISAAELTQDTDKELALEWALEVPLTAEFFLSDNFSLSVATGLLLRFVPQAGAALSPSGFGGGGSASKAAIVGVGAGSVLGTLGIVYYF